MHKLPLMAQQQQQWERVEARLRQTCARTVGVYARASSLPTVAHFTTSAPDLSGSSRTAAGSAAQAVQLPAASAWQVYLEVACAHRARVCGRVDIWTQDDIFRSKGNAGSIFECSGLVFVAWCICCGARSNCLTVGLGMLFSAVGALVLAWANTR